MAFSLKAIIKSFGFQWILVGTWMTKMGDNTSYLAQLCTTILASSPVCCSGSSLFICLTFCSENHVKLTKGNISFLKLCLIWIVTSFWTGSIHLLQFPFLSWNWLGISKKKFVASENPFIWRFPFLIRLWLTFPQAELSFDSIVDKWTLKARVD